MPEAPTKERMQQILSRKEEIENTIQSLIDLRDKGLLNTTQMSIAVIPLEKELSQLKNEIAF